MGKRTCSRRADSWASRSARCFSMAFPFFTAARSFTRSPSASASSVFAACNDHATCQELHEQIMIILMPLSQVLMGTKQPLPGLAQRL